MSDTPPSTLGLSHLAQMIFDGVDLQPTWDGLVARANEDPADAGAWFDLSVILLLTGQAEQGLTVQAQALGLSRLYRRIHGDGSGLRVLAIVTAGGFMANTPLDFMLDGSNVQLDFLYVTGDGAVPAQVPDHDVAFLAIGESDDNQQVLAAVAPALAGWPRPLINGSPNRIGALTRDGVCAMFAGSGRIISPVTSRLERRAVEQIAAGAADLKDHLPDAMFPIIVRPVDSHAGQGLEKIDEVAGLQPYLAQQSCDEFYLSAFYDYSGPDGLFRKARIAFISGAPFVSHLAISSRWMVHYLNADMAERPERRAEEAAFMADFDDTFAVRHAAAFAELQEAFGLDYFAIDCGETRDGRLLLFEADVAMIVHAMDSGTLYPYKKPAMRRLFNAFQSMLEAAALRPACD